MPLQTDYLDRVYAGVLGKLIGVYLGRPFEGWTHARIMAELGPIQYYVHERLGEPLVVTDDDVAGTFTFVRALEDHRASADLSAEEIGKTWLNYIVKDRSILWWGGSGNSTEHTAWLNLKKGIPAPHSGAIAVNGTTVAEQIGAQIFIDGWAMVAPGQPALAAKLARQAGLVSHDGESVHAAVLWAAMEAEAFSSTDVNHLLDTGLSFIPADCLIARLVGDIRGWARETNDWTGTRQRIEDHYGYDKFPGNCHVVPNHALMIMALLHAPHDFQRAQMIVNTSGWDTDCNAGNLGCLQGIMLGLDGLEAGPDWRGPVADRLLVSSADGGGAITDAVRVAGTLVNLGRKLAGEAPLPAPKDGARFHFSLPGSVQGFRASTGPDLLPVRVSNVAGDGHRVLSIGYDALGPGQQGVVTTPTFSPPEVLRMRTYDLMATPTIYPGQNVVARVAAAAGNRGRIAVRLRARVYDGQDRLADLDGPEVTLFPGEAATLDWTIPDLGGQPMAEIGLALTTPDGRADGTVLLDRLGWDGVPELVLRRPQGNCDFWRTAWVNGAHLFSKRFPPSFRVSQDVGEGIIIHGTRDWTDYCVSGDVTLHLGNHGGLAARVQGLCRFYAARLTREGTLQIVRVRDDDTRVLAETSFPVEFERAVHLAVTVRGSVIEVVADDVRLGASDDGEDALRDGGIGLFVHEGAISADILRVGAA